MARNKTSWAKGQSGNPSGRKPKVRALTEILEKAGAATVEINGSKISGKRLIARLLWEAAMTGRATFPDERTLEISPQDWIAIVKFFYQQIDGPPKDVGTMDNPIHNVDWSVDQWRAEQAKRRQQADEIISAFDDGDDVAAQD